eukprot:1568992-Pleurochrysis_carterae.AAC.1
MHTVSHNPPAHLVTYYYSKLNTSFVPILLLKSLPRSVHIPLVKLKNLKLPLKSGYSCWANEHGLEGNVCMSLEWRNLGNKIRSAASIEAHGMFCLLHCPAGEVLANGLDPGLSCTTKCSR